MRLLVVSLLLVVLFFVAYFGVEFGASFLERKRASQEESPVLSNPGGEGAFRDIYFFLWAGIFWSGLCFLLPLSLSFRAALGGAEGKFEALNLFLKISIIPALLLFLILYGHRRGYLRWIKELNWPKQR